MGNYYHAENKPSLRLGQAGFTLIEMVVVTAVFVIVMIVASEAFLRIMSRSNILSQREESNIEGVVALEMFRKDLVQAGFGLPLEFAGTSAPNYNEADEAPASTLNDSGTTTKLPRPFVSGNDLEIVGGPLAKTDYLALKGSPLSRNEAARKWTYVNYSSVGKSPKAWSDDSLQNGDRVVVLKRAFSDTGYTSKLMHNGDTFFTTYDTAALDVNFRPQVQGETCYVYGISSDQDPRMPFNRSDYYVKRTADIPASCADNTGVLIKAVVKQVDGKLDEVPILDCVADMQVVFGWDTADDGVIDTYSNADGTVVSGTGTQSDVQAAMADAANLRKKLKLVKVYLMVQDGGRDPSFRNQQEIVVGNKDNGEESLTKKYTVANLAANNWTNYRWKVYRIVVTPKNL
jgi:prepilin-type N-terminal cleavage/methylation domain-containing protein